MEEEIKKKEKEGWIRCWFAIEAMGVREDVVKPSLEKHIEKLKQIPVAYVYKTEFGDVEKVENPPKNLKEAFSQVVDVELFVKDVFSLMNVVMRFGPSAIEIMGPEKREMSLDEIQNTANLVAGMMHKFAAVGAGGILMQGK